MKKWNRWIGTCAVSSTFMLGQSLTMAQQGYNSGAGQPNQVRGQAAGAQASGNAVQPNAGQPNAVPNVPVANAQAANVQAANAPVTRDPYADNPLTAEEQQHLDQLLNYWEHSTKDIERLSCEFLKFEYNSNANFVQQLAQQTNEQITNIPTSISSGVVRFMKPDKGLYQIKESIVLSGKLDKNNKIERIKPANMSGEHWICDGNTVHNYDHDKKVVTHYSIPAEMQGVGILESPMPFLLGVEAKKLKERYWLRPKAVPTNNSGTQLYGIEAYPKTQQDAVNYSHVLVYLDSKEFLPLHLIVYKTEHNDNRENWVDARDHYEFKVRQKNASVFTKLSEAIFMKEFIPVQVGSDWTEENRTYAAPGSVEQQMEAMAPQNGIAQPNQQPNFQPGNPVAQPGMQPGLQPGTRGGQAVPVRTNPNPVPANVPNAASRPGANVSGTR